MSDWRKYHEDENPQVPEHETWDTHIDTRSIFDALQVLLSTSIGVKEGKGCAILFGGGAAISLLFQQLAQEFVRFKCRTFFRRR